MEPFLIQASSKNAISMELRTGALLFMDLIFKSVLLQVEAPLALPEVQAAVPVAARPVEAQPAAAQVQVAAPAVAVLPAVAPPVAAQAQVRPARPPTVKVMLKPLVMDTEDV